MTSPGVLPVCARILLLLLPSQHALHLLLDVHFTQHALQSLADALDALSDSVDAGLDALPHRLRARLQRLLDPLTLTLTVTLTCP